MTKIAISEIFHSIQGEGIHTGEPTTFIRFQGCSLGCVWCDSKYTWDKDLKSKIMDTDSIVEAVKSISRKTTKWICITGGEPLEQMEGFKELTTRLLQDCPFMDIEVETSGLVPIVRLSQNRLIHSWVVDLKCPSSKVQGVPIYEDLKTLREVDQLKAVVSDGSDLAFVDHVLKYYSTRAKVLISPLGAGGTGSSREWMEECANYCIARGYRLSLQIHKFIWGSRRGV